MIKLEVEQYCNDCPYFEPRVNSNVLYGDANAVERQTTITCEEATRCRTMYQLIKKEMGESAK